MEAMCVKCLFFLSLYCRALREGNDCATLGLLASLLSIYLQGFIQRAYSVQ